MVMNSKPLPFLQGEEFEQIEIKSSCYLHQRIEVIVQAITPESGEKGKFRVPAEICLWGRSCWSHVLLEHLDDSFDILLEAEHVLV
jgi:hypothetical protein